MTQPRRRFRAVRLTVQFAALGALASAIIGGCSSGVKTVTVEDCPLGGATSAGGHAPLAAGTGESGGNTSPDGTAGEAEIGQGGESSGGESLGGESSGGGAAVSGRGGTPGSGGKAANGGTAGKSTSNGGSGNAGGHSGGGGGASASGGNSAVCGDKAVTPPEFCDDGTNTDLSYGCYACTTLPPPTGGAGSAGSAPQQCGDCLQGKSQPSSCFGCNDHRACYACLRRQSQTFPDLSICNTYFQDDEPDPEVPTTRKLYSDRCFNPNDTEYQTATGGPAGNKSRGLVCQALVACVLRTGCLLGNNADGSAHVMYRDCYCGVIPSGHNCGDDPTFVPNGPCATEIKNADAPGPTTILPELNLEIAVNIAAVDPGEHYSALGVANQIASCAADPLGCADVCFPNASGTGGATGTAGTGGVSGNAGTAGVGGH